MAKKITILENAVEKSVSKVAKIKTKLANGRDCYWVPEEDYPLGVLNVTEDGVYNASSDPNGPFYGYSEVNVEGVGNVEMGTLGTITITANGTYEAATDSQGPFYGYSTVIVNVSDEDAAPDHISGKDPDGNDEVVTVDDDGHLVKETVPSSIKIISPPDILTYYDGELIDFHGIYVKGYLEDGTEWGVVPNNELSFPEPIAEYVESITYKYGTATLDGKSINYLTKILTSTNKEGDQIEYTDFYVEDGWMLASLRSNGGYNVTGYSLRGTSVFAIDNTRGGTKVQWPNVSTRALTVNKRTRYYMTGGDFLLYNINPEITVDNSRSLENIAILIDGMREEVEIIPADSIQTIPIQWHRPGDGKSLYDNFEITVTKPDDSGGQDPQPAPTPSPD